MKKAQSSSLWRAGEIGLYTQTCKHMPRVVMIRGFVVANNEVEPMHHTLQQFKDYLPEKPYCSNELIHGVCIQQKNTAVQFKYLQANHPYYQRYLILDLDYDAVMVEIFYSLIGVPLPNLLIENPQNGKAHLLFELETPIYKTDASRQKPIMYANAILRRLQQLYDADVGYSGLLIKNPFCEQWRVYHLHKTPYSLQQLADKLEITWQDAQKAPKTADFGRNCSAFQTLRTWAYKAIWQYRGKTYSQWQDAVLLQCTKINQGFVPPLQYGEIKGIAKSVARYCWKKDPHCYQEFIQRQKYKGKLGGKASQSSAGGKARSRLFVRFRQEAFQLHQQGMNKTQIAQKLRVNRRTVIRWMGCDSASLTQIIDPDGV